MVTSWGLVLLGDFEPFKPAVLPTDNPAPFSLFFDAGARRRCYLAPERFVDTPTSVAQDAAPVSLSSLPRGPGGASSSATRPAGRSGRPRGTTALSAAPELSAAADIFSLGCCLAELYLDGRELFDLGALLSYRAGSPLPEQLLSLLPSWMVPLILSMLHREPASRPSAAAILGALEPHLRLPSGWQRIYQAFQRWRLAWPDARAAEVLALAEELGTNADGHCSRGRGSPVESSVSGRSWSVPASLDRLVEETEGELPMEGGWVVVA